MHTTCWFSDLRNPSFSRFRIDANSLKREAISNIIRIWIEKILFLDSLTIYNYSPYHYYYPNGVKTLRPVYRMIERAKKGEPIELWGNPEYSKEYGTCI